jgi:hypothetical protein
MGRSRDLANLISGTGTLPNGAIPSGSVVQVQAMTDNTNSKKTITTANFADLLDTSLSITITPKFIGSTVLIQGSFYMASTLTNQVITSRVVRVTGGVTTVTHLASSGTTSGGANGANGFAHVYSAPTVAQEMGKNNFSFVTNSTTVSLDAHVFKLQLGGITPNHEIHYNQYGNTSLSYEDNYTPVSMMSVMEIKA